MKESIQIPYNYRKIDLVYEKRVEPFDNGEKLLLFAKVLEPAQIQS